jgi:L-ascorbate metabolism protein UlaG (beta-lactamase superfamily)
MIDRIQWLGHGSFAVQGTPLIYINPWRIARTALPADIILVSHDRYDNCSLADIDRLRGEHTRIIGTERVAREIPGCTVLLPWQSIAVERACIKAVPAYSPDARTNMRQSGGLGFVISLNYYDIYYAGETGLIPEMSSIHPDIAILPIGGEGTMTPEQAAQATALMRPRWVIPCNWGSSSSGANRVDAQRFQQGVGAAAEVLLLTPER